MRAIGSLLPLLIIGAIVYGLVHASRSGGSAPRQTSAPVAPGPATVAAPQDLAEDLRRWASAGLVTDEQVAAILAYERAPVPHVVAPTAPSAPGLPRRIPAVAEALGYLGGMLAITGLGLILSRYWPDMATAGRLAMSGTAAVALVAAGALAREQVDPALARLRWFLWLAATAAAALFAGVLTLDGLDAADETVVLVCAATVAALSALLWWGHDRPLQQLTLMAALVVTAGAVVAEFSTGAPIGFAAWAVGAVFVALGVRRATPLPLLTDSVGAVAMLVGATIAASGWEGPGLLFSVATAFGLLTLATVPRLAPERADQLVLGIVGGVALAQSAPSAIGWYSRDAGVMTGLVTWAIGALLLFVGARNRVRLRTPTVLLGGAGLIGGAAITGAQWEEFAPLFGVVTAIALVALGMLPDQVLLSMLGAVGLLVNVPWAIGVFFPGEGRAPLLIMVSGALIIAVAILLTRQGGRVRDELGSTRHRRPPRDGVAPRPSS